MNKKDYEKLSEKNLLEKRALKATISSTRIAAINLIVTIFIGVFAGYIAHLQYELSIAEGNPNIYTHPIGNNVVDILNVGGAIGNPQITNKEIDLVISIRKNNDSRDVFNIDLNNAFEFKLLEPDSNSKVVAKVMPLNYKYLDLKLLEKRLEERYVNSNIKMQLVGHGELVYSFHDEKLHSFPFNLTFAMDDFIPTGDSKEEKFSLSENENKNIQGIIDLISNSI